MHQSTQCRACTTQSATVYIAHRIGLVVVAKDIELAIFVALPALSLQAIE
jgi:hypothetical protein